MDSKSIFADFLGMEFSQFYHAPWIDAIRATLPAGWCSAMPSTGRTWLPMQWESCLPRGWSGVTKLVRSRLPKKACLMQVAHGFMIRFLLHRRPQIQRRTDPTPHFHAAVRRPTALGSHHPRSRASLAAWRLRTSAQLSQLIPAIWLYFASKGCLSGTASMVSRALRSSRFGGSSSSSSSINAQLSNILRAVEIPATTLLPARRSRSVFRKPAPLRFRAMAAQKSSARV